jgi:hypothetical protein
LRSTDYYLTQLDSEGQVSIATHGIYGTFRDELNEMRQFVTEALSANCYDSYGNFSMDLAIDRVFSEYETSVATLLETIPTINDLNSPVTATYNGILLIDPEILSEVDGVLLVPELFQIGYLTIYQQNDTIAGLMNQTSVNGLKITYGIMNQADRISLWTYYGTSTTIQDLLDSGVLTDSSDIVGRFSPTITITQLLNTTISSEITASLNSCINNHITLYAIKFAKKTILQYKQIFKMLIDFEEEMREHLSQISLDKITWHGKYAGWEE